MTSLPSLSAKLGVSEDDEDEESDVSMSESEDSEDSESVDSEVSNRSRRVARYSSIKAFVVLIRSVSRGMVVDNQGNEGKVLDLLSFESI